MSENVNQQSLPSHIAYIMDGNGRWAISRGLPRAAGHRAGVSAFKRVLSRTVERGVGVITCYVFSTENWNRPQEEIDHLMDYLEEFFYKEIDYIDSKGARLIVSGDLSRIREQTRKVCLEAIERTKNNNKYVINVCLNYGGRDEIVRACKQIATLYKEDKVKLEDINEKSFSSYLYTASLPDVDLMIRTSGEERLSNFLLYQNAYAEFVFTKVKWPDFKKREFYECLERYQRRSRRYGGLKNE